MLELAWLCNFRQHCVFRYSQAHNAPRLIARLTPSLKDVVQRRRVLRLVVASKLVVVLFHSSFARCEGINLPVAISWGYHLQARYGGALARRPTPKIPLSQRPG